MAAYTRRRETGKLCSREKNGRRDKPRRYGKAELNATWYYFFVSISLAVQWLPLVSHGVE
jgi:hypothetical protein